MERSWTGLLRRTERAAILCLPLLLHASCGSDSTGDLPTSPEEYSYEYRVPEETGDGWETTSLSDVGLSEAPFIGLMEELHSLQNPLVHSLLVVRGGKLVFEEYFQGQKVSLAQYTGDAGFDRDDTHNLASVTKSITTTLVGLAMDGGYIASVEEPVFDFFPEHADLVAGDPRRAEITLEQLMLMTSGMVWNDDVVPYTDPQNDMVRMFNSNDPIRFALSTELVHDPGTEFEYCNANTNILGEVVRRATGQRLDIFAATRLFVPLGIVESEWQWISGEFALASGDLRLRPRDMAKIGQLLLNQGRWDGEQVVSSQWIQTATDRLIVPYGPHAWADGYGYGWWHWDLVGNEGTVQVIMASGWGGQWIVAIPEHDMVFVTTGGTYFSPTLMSADRILQEYVFQAIQ